VLFRYRVMASFCSVLRRVSVLSDFVFVFVFVFVMLDSR
jgi:hypothetical protein